MDLIKPMNRHPQHPIERCFFERCSSRALSGEGITHEEFLRLCEAARWAPSSYNNQPWHFIYAHRDTHAWQPLFDLLVDFNKGWVHNAAVLMILCSHKTYSFNGKPAITHSFDTGAAWQNMALQAYFQGLIAHGIAGFDYARAREVAKIPDAYAVEAMIAIGRPGNPADLPHEIRERETPSNRNEVSTFLHTGVFSL